MNIDNLSELKYVVYHKIRIENLPTIRQHLSLVRKSGAVVTCDDGDPSFYEILYPELVAQKIPALLFIISGLIDTTIPFWWDEVTYYLGEKEGTEKVNWLKKIPNIERLKFLETLRRESRKPPLRTKQLTTVQLKEMQEAGITIANHSHSHPMFDQCPEAESRQELRSSKKYFELNNLNGYNYFAYPNGNFSAHIEEIIKDEGITFAFLFDHKINRHPINRLRISRLSINDDTPMWKLKFILSGWHSRVLTLRKGIHKLLK